MDLPANASDAKRAPDGADLFDQSPTRDETSSAQRACKILLVYPRFSPDTFWNFAEACKAFGARCPAPPLGLITVAALLPSSWTLRLVDRNAEELTKGHLDWANLGMTGGMVPK